MTTGRLARLELLVLVVLAACGSGSATRPPPTAPPGGTVIVATNNEFDRSEIDVTAGAPFALLFENRDAVPHNVAIVAPDGAPLYVGETFSGTASKTYAVPALTPGRYLFRCDVHPFTMVGEVVAG
ncbi:MAG: cupredoxin domain-containing protein [Chloroflexi bacterium]|nr:cupredoxin domain-containing protein [Chloroflexota bacterium]